MPALFAYLDCAAISFILLRLSSVFAGLFCLPEPVTEVLLPVVIDIILLLKSSAIA